MIKGSCLCGDVTFEIDESKIAMVNCCHCRNCRKVTGADFGTFIQIAEEDFTWLSGEERVSTFESSPGNHRAFCQRCGSRMPQSNDAWPYMSVPAGTLDKDPQIEPSVHIFTADKAPWGTIDDSIPSAADGGSPEFWASVLSRGTPIV